MARVHLPTADPLPGEEHFGGGTCYHNRGYDCDGFFHYCRGCGYPLDECACPDGTSPFVRAQTRRARGGNARP